MSISFQRSRISRKTVIAAALLFFAASQPAYAYIDPGVTSLLAQGLFGVVFGSMAAWVLTPWNYIKRLFGFHTPQATDDGEKKDTDVSA